MSNINLKLKPIKTIKVFELKYIRKYNYFIFIYYKKIIEIFFNLIFIIY